MAQAPGVVHSFQKIRVLRMWLWESAERFPQFSALGATCERIDNSLVIIRDRMSSYRPLPC
eukprot:1524716-Amphidinium_carterae.1